MPRGDWGRSRYKHRAPRDPLSFQPDDPRLVAIAQTDDAPIFVTVVDRVRRPIGAVLRDNSRRVRGGVRFDRTRVFDQFPRSQSLDTGYPLAVSDQFESETDALAVIGVRLAARVKDVPDAGRIDWVRVLSPSVLTDRIEIVADPKTPSTSAPAMVRRFRYVIRTDDLKLVESLMDAVAALIPTGLVVPVSQPAAAAGAVTTAIVHGLKLLKRLRDKGARLDERSFTALTVLRSNGPMHFDQLLSLLRAYDLSWTANELSGLLADLMAYPSRDGSALALVKSSAQGQEWRTTEF
jgi:hypothetical protein